MVPTALTRLVRRAAQGYDDGLIPIWLPELSQDELLVICHAIAQSEMALTAGSDNRAHLLLAAELRNLQYDLDSVIGDGFREPAVFFKAMSLLSANEQRDWWARVGSKGLRFFIPAPLIASLADD